MATKYKLSYTAADINERLKRIDNFDLILELLDAAVYVSDKSEVISLLKQNLGIVDDTPVSNTIYWTKGYGIANGVYQNGLLCLNTGYNHRITAYQLSGNVPFYQNGTFADYDVYPITIPNGATTLTVTVPDGYIHGVMFWQLDGSSVTLVNDYGWNGNTFTYIMSDYKGATHITVNVKNSSNTEITYNGDFSDFSVVFDYTVIDEPVVDIVVSEIVRGTSSFVEGAGLQIHRGSSEGTMAHRATLMPCGQYLKNGSKYRFSIGDATSKYSFGVQIMQANASGLVFNSADMTEVYYNTVTSRLVDTGWMTDDYEYTVTGENQIFTMNFKITDTTNGTDMTTDDYATLLENIVIEEIEEQEGIVVSEIVYGSTSFVDGAGLQINRGNSENTMKHRATVVPVGQYLKNGSKYRFSIGEAANTYSFGVQIMQANASGLEFDHGEYLTESYFNTVTSRLVDTGWMTSDYEYIATGDNLIFTMNFKITADGWFTENDFATLLANVVIEEVA